MRSAIRICLAALALTVAATTVAQPANSAAGFGDVEANRWYTAPIAWMVTEGITNGTEPGCFSPTSPVSRGEIVTFLYRLDQAQGNAPETADHPFVDVVRSYQHEPIGWAYDVRVTTGTSATTFAPDANVTRGDFAVLLWRYAGQPAPIDAHPFVDITRGYQNTAISWMAENGITTGTSPTTFSPEGTMTRAEAATFLFRYIAPSGQPASLNSEAHCLQWYRDLMMAAGLTQIEAACVAPFLVDLDRDYLVAVLNGDVPVGGPIIGVLSDVINAGCISAVRSASVISIFW